MKRIVIYIVLILTLLSYYKFEYERYFVCSADGKECLTIWQRSNGKCYLIPDKYFSPIVPKSNFVQTKNHRNYIGIIWDTKDENNLKISVYHDYSEQLNDKIKVYSNNDSLMLEYGLLEEVDIDKGLRLKSQYFDSLKHVYDYKYIDLNRVFGIKEF